MVDAQYRDMEDTFKEVVLTAVIIGAIAAITLMILSYDRKQNNFYGVIIFYMACGVLLFDLDGIYSAFKGYSKSTLWIYLIGGTGNLISYLLSTILSFQLYYLLAFKDVLSFRENVLFRRASLVMLVITLAVFYTVTLTSFYESNARIRKHSFFNLCTISIKIFYALLNLIFYVLCELQMKSDFTSNSSTVTRQYLAIKVVVRRKGMMPLVQFVCILPYFIVGCIHNFTFIANKPPPHYDDRKMGLDLFCISLDYLEAVGLLIIYLIWHPDATARLKEFFCCGSLMTAIGRKSNSTTGITSSRIRLPKRALDSVGSQLAATSNIGSTNGASTNGQSCDITSTNGASTNGQSSNYSERESSNVSNNLEESPQSTATDQTEEEELLALSDAELQRICGLGLAHTEPFDDL